MVIAVKTYFLFEGIVRIYTLSSICILFILYILPPKSLDWRIVLILFSQTKSRKEDGSNMVFNY